jgi:uncharacterized protein (TIGR02231 family)
MKKLTSILTLLVLSMSAFAEEEGYLKANSKIQSVTVFVQGAQITRKGSVSIPKGMSTIIFDGVASQVDPNSLQASGLGNFTITDVQYRYYHPEPMTFTHNELPDRIVKGIALLTDSIAMVSLREAEYLHQMNSLQKEQTLIENHPLMNGGAKKDSLDLLIASANFLKARLVDIGKRRLLVQRQLHEIGALKTKLNIDLQALRNYQSNETPPKQEEGRYQILISVVSSSAVYGSIEVVYYSQAAAWYPHYDLHASGIKDDLKIVYKAQVQQSTGVDWNDVRLKISNANPRRRKTKPLLPVWYVQYYERVQVQAKSALRSVPTTMVESVEMDDAQVMMEEKDVAAGIASEYTTKMHNFSSVEFSIDLPYQIKSNGKLHYVVLKSDKVKTSFEHHLIPKMDRNAYLVAKLTEWRDLDLLLGNANVYFGNTFVGQTVIDPTILSDTLAISLGHDERVSVERKVLKSETRDKLLTNKKIYSSRIQLSIKNANKEEIFLHIEDHTPISYDESISVAVSEMGNGKLSPATGSVIWEKKLAGGARDQIEFGFEIEYLGEKILTGVN